MSSFLLPTKYPSCFGFWHHYCHWTSCEPRQKMLYKRFNLPYHLSRIASLIIVVLLIGLCKNWWKPGNLNQLAVTEQNRIILLRFSEMQSHYDHDFLNHFLFMAYDDLLLQYFITTVIQYGFFPGISKFIRCTHLLHIGTYLLM